jgi:hypothetical protein
MIVSESLSVFVGRVQGLFFFSLCLSSAYVEGMSLTTSLSLPGLAS